MTQNKPNIVLINCDDLGYGDLSCYGCKVHSTPYLDKMADEGIRFTDFYAASPVCSPSRGSLMTGCYPNRIGFGLFEGEHVLFPGQGVGLSTDEVTVADTLKEAGYSTMIIGKWHCGDQPEFLPTRHGFDHYYGLPYSNDMGRQVGGRGVTRPPLPLICDDEVIEEQPDQSGLTERYLEQAVRFIRQNKEKPFFLYFAHMYVHIPLYVPERFKKQSRNGSYGAAVECIDWAAGVLIKELERQGLDKNTLVIFTSDNGSRNDNPGSNGPLRANKATTWEGGQRVPCIMYWPGVIKPGVVSSEIVTAMDFMPTFTLLGGGKVPDDRIIDGKDIRNIIFGEEGAKSQYNAFYYFRKNSIEAVRAGKWKLHVRKEKTVINELYDLESDISEKNNVYELYLEVVAELQKLIDEGRQDMGDDRAGIKGRNCRPIGRVESPKPLTDYCEDNLYYIAMYDLAEKG